MRLKMEGMRGFGSVSKGIKVFGRIREVFVMYEINLQGFSTP